MVLASWGKEFVVSSNEVKSIADFLEDSLWIWNPPRLVAGHYIGSLPRAIII